MRLFGKVDGSINRFDRADWLTMPFDLSWLATVYEVITDTAYICRSITGDAHITRELSGTANICTLVSSGVER